MTASLRRQDSLTQEVYMRFCIKVQHGNYCTLEGAPIGVGDPLRQHAGLVKHRPWVSLQATC